MTAPPAPDTSASPEKGDWRTTRVALCHAAELIGGTPDLPDTSPDSPDPVAAAASATGLRARRVRVEDALHRQPPTPLLAIRAADGLPVLVRGGRTIDPDRPVAAEDLTSAAWQLHRRLPYQGLTGWGLLGFAVAGLRGRLVVLLGTALAAGLLGFAVPIGSLTILGATASGQVGVLVAATAVLLAGVLTGAVLSWQRDRSLISVQSHVHVNVEVAVWDRLLGLDLSFFRGYSPGRLAAHVAGITRLRAILASGTLDVLLGAVFTVLALVVLVLVDPLLAIVALAAMALLGALLGLLAWLQNRHDQEVFAGVEDAQALMYPALLGIDEIRAYGREELVFDRWWATFARQKRADAAGLRYAELSSALLSAVQPGLLAVLLPLAWAAGGGDALIVVGFAGIQLSAALGRLGPALQSLFAAGPMHDRLRPVLTAPPETRRRALVPGKLSGALELSGVTFRFPDSTTPVLQDISLSVRPGEFLAVVGPSGAGKSSLLRLLLGLDRPDAGRVSYDGHDVAELDLDALRAQIGFVPQDARTLRGDLRSVILGAAVGATDEDAWEAARAAGIAEEIGALPMGLDTRLSDGDTGFSGGQVQRLLLARALSKRPRVLLLDEATSALDNLTQDLVAERVARLGVTRVVVAHRLSTIRCADRIAVVEAGRVTECGTYDELLLRGGTFAGLAGHE
ncbi:ATP-binding cassette domain-containing protein [Nonomuraea sp. NPDC000554]|uniref:ATP-binding cassette domain-containing protein n=1 Tax=Nonomuraea sp. NPDC000554 TaxID=3154259 RepID=UPI00332E2736